MFKRNQLFNSFVVAGVALASTAAFAQQTEQTTASVTVQNAFTLTEDAPLSFGTITASRVSGTSAEIVLSPDGTQDNSGAEHIRVIASGTPAAYTVASAAAFADLAVSVAADSITLANPAAPGSNPTFTVGSFTVSDGTNSTGVTSAGLAATTGFTTDVNGALSITLGGTLTQPGVGADAAMTDGTYEGQFTLEVDYR